ncbi:MAG: hypothetical protein AB7P40_14000 [Chloroflexota bacterium]
MVALMLTLLVACEQRPVERPLEGARPVVGGTSVRLENIVPPTLAPALSLVSTQTPTPAQEAAPSPSPGLVANPASSPGIAPIISGLLPAPGAMVPAGDVVVAARVTGSSKLVDIMAIIDDEPVPIDLGAREVWVKALSLVRTFAVGTHEIRIQARDERGQIGGYRWQFNVGSLRQPTTIILDRPAASDGPTATPFPIPTRRPTIAPARPTVVRPTSVLPAILPSPQPRR